MSVYDGMMEKLGGKVSRMKPPPVIKDWQDACPPGERRTTGEDGVVTVYALTEDPNWAKVDKLILKALDAMKKKGVERPLAVLQDASFLFALENKGQGLQLFAWRLLNTRYFVEEYGRLRAVAAGKKKPRDSDRLRYGGDGPIEQIKLVGDALRVRGILRPKMKRE